MKRSVRMALIVCGWVAVAVQVLLLLASPYVWLRSSGTVVLLNGRPTALAAVYRSWNGHLLVWVREQSGEIAYLIRASERHVVIPNRSTFVRTARFAWSKEKRPSGVGINASKADLADNPPPVFQADYVEFTSMSSHRVRVEL